MRNELLKRSHPAIQQRELKALYGDLNFNGDSAFEIFLRYSNQKEKLAGCVSNIISEHFINNDIDIFDIGVGEGTFHAKLIRHLMQNKNFFHIHVDLLDPNAAHVIELKGERTGLMETYPGRYSAKIHHKTWEEFDESQARGKKDIVICSHAIYHLKPEEFKVDFQKMIQLLKPGGLLFIVARLPDQPYEFIKSYYEKATGKPFNEITINDAIPVLKEIVAEDEHLTIEQELCEAEINLPFASNSKDAYTIVGFYLRTQWEKIKTPVRNEIIQAVQNSDIKLHQIDGIITITKKS